MSNIIDSVGTILSYFLDWFTTGCSYLITNPFVIIILGVGISLLIYNLFINTTKEVSQSSSSNSIGRKHYTKVWRKSLYGYGYDYTITDEDGNILMDFTSEEHDEYYEEPGEDLDGWLG